MYNVVRRDYPYSTEFIVYFKGIKEGDDFVTLEKSKKGIKSFPRSDLVDFLDCPVSPFDGDAPSLWFEEDHLVDNESYKQWNYAKTVNKIFDYARCNTWRWFVTFTFDPDKIDSTDYDVVSKCVSNWRRNLCKRCKRLGMTLDSLIVPELHKDGKKYHFHALMSGIPPDELIYSGIRKGKHKSKVYNWESFEWGFTTVIEIYDDLHIGKYLCKYITKQLIETVPPGRKKYWASRGLLLPSEQTYLVQEDKLSAFMKELSGQCSFSKRIDFPNTNNRKYIFSIDNEGC